MIIKVVITTLMLLLIISLVIPVVTNVVGNDLITSISSYTHSKEILNIINPLDGGGDPVNSPAHPG